MANGLRKIIKKARREYNRSAILASRLNRLGKRLGVEELEERIAPATVALVTGELIAWDTAAGGGAEAIDAGDGFIGLGNNTTAGITVQVADVTFAAGNDSATLNLSITADTAGAAAKTIHIVTNQVLGTVNLSGLSAATTGVTLLIQSGYDPAAAAANVVTSNIDGMGAATSTQTAANIAEALGPGAIGVTNFTFAANAGMGLITMPSVSGANVPVSVHLITDGTGAISGITSADTDLDLTDDAADSLIDCGSLGAVAWAGDVLPDANGITITVDDDGGTGITSLSFGSINVGGVGSLAISSEGIGAITISGGITSGAAGSGNITIDADTGATDDSMGAVSIGAITLGDFGCALVLDGGDGGMGAVGLAGISVDGTSSVTFQGASIGAITSTAAIQTLATATGDIAFTANGATGTMGAISVTAGGIVAGAVGADIAFSANDGMGAISVTGNVGGVGAVSFAADAGGTADTGNIPTITVNGSVGHGTGAVAFSGNQLTGATHVTGDMASAGAVTFTFKDGIGSVTVDGDTAQGANIAFLANSDGADDAGTMGALTSQTLGDASDGTGVITINTNGGAADNTTVRPVGAITATDGNAHLSIVADGTVALISISGGDGSNGNELTLDNLSLNASGDPTTSPNVVGITLQDIATESELLTLTAGGVFVIPGTLGPIVCGGSDAGDVVDINNNNVQVFAGDDPSNTFAAVYTAVADSKIDITCGFFQDDAGTTGTIRANTRAASDIFRLAEGTNVTRVTVASDVTADVLFDPNGGNADNAAIEPSITIADLAGTTSGDDLEILSEDGTDVDVLGILPATDGNVDVDTIVIGGDLLGDIGSGALTFDAVGLIIIQGTDGANDFFGNGLMGYASQTGTLGLAGVDVLALDTAGDGTEDIEILSGIAGSIFMFADAAGADNAVDQFNHHVAVAGGVAGASAILRGVDGDGTVNEFQLDLDGAVGGSGPLIDPANVFPDNTFAMINRIMLDGVGGLSTDVSVREVDGTTNGSFLEFNSSVGLINLTTPIDSVSVGIADCPLILLGDLVDNAVVTGNATNAGNKHDLDRLGGGEAGGAKSGLIAATYISDVNAALGNMVVQSMVDTAANVDTDGDGDVDGADGDQNISIVVTGNCGPITLTGDTALLVPDHGYLFVDATAVSAAIAIGGNLAGALTIPGGVDGDILIGIGLDLNGDGDDVDVDLTEVIVGHDLNGDGDALDGDLYSELPGGSANAVITIGSMGTDDILVATDVTDDIVIQGQEQDIAFLPTPVPVLELPGNVGVIAAIGILGNDADDDIVIESGVDYIFANGALNADIFTGGAGVADAVIVEGTGITGGAVIGGSSGVLSVMIWDHAVADDTGDCNQITIDGGGAMTVQWVAGDIAANTVGDVYIRGVAGNFVVTTLYGDPINTGDIYLLDNGTINITSGGNVGVMIAADNVTIPTSEDLQDTVTTTYDVVQSPTLLDLASGDNPVALNWVGSIQAHNAGGIVAEVNVVVVAPGILVSGNMGYIVALSGSITAPAANGGVHAGDSIGHIVASEDIDGTFVSEGTLAIGDATALFANLTSLGLTGVPSWFNGGILSEAGDIGSNTDEIADLDTGTMWDAVTPNEAKFVANGDYTYVQDVEMPTDGEVMGSIFVPGGSISAHIHSGGDFGGLTVPAGAAWLELQVNDFASISHIVVPNNFYDGPSGIAGHSAGGNAESAWNPNRVNILVIEGEEVVTVTTPLDTDTFDVSVTGATTFAIVEFTAGNDITLAGGLAVGSSLIVAGDIDDLIIKGNWAGAVIVTGNAQDETDGEIAFIAVDGDIAATADLTAFNFGDLEVQGTNAVETTGILTERDSETFTNLAGVDQTLFLNAGRGVSARWTNVFGKMTEINLVGAGNASLISVNADLDASDNADLRVLRAIASHARAGAADVNLLVEGSAHLGEVNVIGGSLNLSDVVVNGDLGSLNTARNVNSLWVSDDAGGVAAGNINKAFIGGAVTNMSAVRANNIFISEGAGTISVFQMNNSVVNGTTGVLTAGTSEWNGLRFLNRGGLINCKFEGVLVNNVVRAIGSSIG